MGCYFLNLFIEVKDISGFNNFGGGIIFNVNFVLGVYGENDGVYVFIGVCFLLSYLYFNVLGVLDLR